jgi:hypothetical protein
MTQLKLRVQTGQQTGKQPISFLQNAHFLRLARRW